MYVAQDLILNETNVTTVDKFSEALDVRRLYGMSLHVVSTGIVSAVLKVQVSNDDGVTWQTLANPTLTVTDAAGGAISIPDLFYQKARLWLDMTSGSGNTVKIYYCAKGI